MEITARDRHQKIEAYPVVKCPLSHSFKEAFSSAKKYVVKRPSRWSTPESPVTFVRLLYDEKYLYCGFELEKDTFKKNALLSPADGGKWAKENSVPERMQSLLQDDRCECFIWPVRPGSLSEQHYFAFEVTRGGAAVQSRTRFYRKFDFNFDGKIVAKSVEPGGGKSIDAKVALDAFVFAVPWSSVSSSKTMGQYRIGLFRGTRDRGGDFRWASVVDPEDEKIDFHRPETFGLLCFV